MYYEEDLGFGKKTINVVIRFDNKAVSWLQKESRYSFEDLKRFLNDSHIECFFKKKNEDEHYIIIPITSENINLKLTLKWLPKTHDYKVVLSKKTKLVVEEFNTNLNDSYTLARLCSYELVGFNDNPFPSKEFAELHKEICNLEISPKAYVENQRDIWTKWIEAQELILSNNSTPFSVKKYYPLLPIKGKDGNIFRYQFQVDLVKEENPEYKELEKELRKQLGLDIKVDGDTGETHMRLKDIYKGLDVLINRAPFCETYSRKEKLLCLFKLKPIFVYKKIEALLNDLGRKVKVWQGDKSGLIEIYSKNNRTVNVPKSIIKKYSLKREAFIGRIFIVDSNGLKIEDSIPSPIKTNNYNRIKDQYNSLKKVLFNKREKEIEAGANSIHFQIREVYSFVQNSEENEFDDLFWQDLKQDLFGLGFDSDDVRLNSEKRIIAFNFIDFDELEDKIEKIKGLNKFYPDRDPLAEDFEFRVKIDLLAKKNKKQLFDEKLKFLHGTEFYIERVNKKGKIERPSIGILNYYQSSMSSLLFAIPLRTKKDLKQVKKLKKYLEEDSTIITEVYPNLRGDEVKIGWLNEAMAKINTPQDQMNKKPVNTKLGEFIFDSSKAEEIYKDLSTDSEEWKQLVKHELLQLNDSQRKAVLSALYARDLALLQGPPGTGKTTVIAEMIWQMIRVNQKQKVLLTSETNLAVDNALVKLLNGNHTLVKPLRFGKVAKLENEGKKYSFDRIMKWIDKDYGETNLEDEEENEEESYLDSLGELDLEDEEEVDENHADNAVQIWMNRIASNAQIQNPKYSEIIKDWVTDMAMPETEMKELFKDKYIKHANVVGSTSSSAGSITFACEYQKLFNPDKKVELSYYDRVLEERVIEEECIGKLYKRIKNVQERYEDFDGRFKGVNNILERFIPLEFDIVITDEASKATPPELLLPMCFGKKNVIIGDHKQLPPMLHEKSFEETLLALESEEAKELAEEIDKDFVGISQFERLITHPKVSPSIKSSFNLQYRMHPQINKVIKQFYSDSEEGLEPAPQLLEHADDANLNNPFSRHHGLYYKGFITPFQHVIWVDVDAPEQESGTSRVNETEVEAIKLVLKMLRNSNGFDEYMNHWSTDKKEDQEIGLITFYGHQVKKLKEAAKYAREELKIPIRLNTVDKFQGMERNIIIVSTVRSNKLKLDSGKEVRNSDIGFAKSPKRLNVALSRARRLLIIVGNKDFFKSYIDTEGNAIYRNVINVIESEQKTQNEQSIIKYEDLVKLDSND
ncbi:AAA domain-containing protein [Aureispira anguillae]|uniref:AAA domain-containing protein n=1 Tax=Aureispira anguillae TaxID=2864201 RepID=A0A915VK87_9BACT|nr:ATP-binding protein [Aureispira anguillae]BDS09576.1 AAA domain-containing protein [Aureispira anguillae]